MSKNGRRLVLVVDNNETNIRALHKIFSKYYSCFDLEDARSGKEAIGEILEKKFSLIVADSRMLGPDGIKALLVAAKLHNFATKIIVVKYPPSVHDFLGAMERVGALSMS